MVGWEVIESWKIIEFLFWEELENKITSKADEIRVRSPNEIGSYGRINKNKADVDVP